MVVGGATDAKLLGSTRTAPVALPALPHHGPGGLCSALLSCDSPLARHCSRRTLPCLCTRPALLHLHITRARPFALRSPASHGRRWVIALSVPTQRCAGVHWHAQLVVREMNGPHACRDTQRQALAACTTCSLYHAHPSLRKGPCHAPYLSPPSAACRARCPWTGFAGGWPAPHWPSRPRRSTPVAWGDAASGPPAPPPPSSPPDRRAPRLGSGPGPGSGPPPQTQTRVQGPTGAHARPPTGPAPLQTSEARARLPA